MQGCGCTCIHRRSRVCGTLARRVLACPRTSRVGCALFERGYAFRFCRVSITVDSSHTLRDPPPSLSPTVLHSTHHVSHRDITDVYVCATQHACPCPASGTPRCVHTMPHIHAIMLRRPRHTHSTTRSNRCKPQALGVPRTRSLARFVLTCRSCHGTSPLGTVDRRGPVSAGGP